MHSTSPDPYKLSVTSSPSVGRSIKELQKKLSRKFTDINADLVALGYTVAIVPISALSLKSRPDSYLASLGGIQEPFASSTSSEVHV